MTAVAVSAGQFAAACLLGMGLGAVYELLRPLRPRLTALSDGLFTGVMLYTWIHLAFGICGGDIRMAQPTGLLLGAFAFRMTLGKLLERAIRAVYRTVGRFVRRLFGPLAAFLKKIWKFVKKIFASGRKSVTIKWINRRHFRRHPGGRTHGKENQPIQPDPAGLPPQYPPDKNSRDRGHRTVYGSADHPGRSKAFGRKTGS